MDNKPDEPDEGDEFPADWEWWKCKPGEFR